MMNESQELTARYQDATLPVAERAHDLLQRMTLEEKISQLYPETKAVPRLGIRSMNFGYECLHGLCQTGRATVFPGVIGLAATFDSGLVRQIADAIASEARAKYQDPAWHGADGKPVIGLSFYTPNINIFRDPRWGRGQETYGEDPVLTGVMASAFVRGLQGDHPYYLKTGACAKHLAVHSGPEMLRREFDAQVSQKDLFETYLPAFKALVDAGVSCVMATYNRLNGEACPGSKTLLVDILRGRWGFKGFVVSDGGAISAMHKFHKVTADEMASAVLCVQCGCDMCNDELIYNTLPEAIRRGLITEADVDRCVSHVLQAQFRLGLHDRPELVPYSSIRADVIQCKKHIALTRQAALQSMVLLKNNGILPLTKTVKTMAVVGPTATDADVLLGNFYRGASANLVTMLEGIVARAPEGVMIKNLPGCYSAHPNLYPSDWHLGLTQTADVIVGVIGLTPLMEGEQSETIGSAAGGDRADINLPAHQIEFVRKLKKYNKPLVLVVTGGSALDLSPIEEYADAIVFAWYPGEQGGNALGDILFGHASPSGRLPITFYASNEQIPPFENYAMTGRTYRYLAQEPLYPFGFGLSYTKFEYGPMRLSRDKIKAGKTITAETTVTNVGNGAAQEVVQLYLADNEASVCVPRCALKSFRTVKLAPGQSAKIKFKITPEMMQLIDNAGNAVLEPGTFTVTIGGSSPGPRSLALGAPAPAVGVFAVTLSNLG